MNLIHYSLAAVIAGLMLTCTVQTYRLKACQLAAAEQETTYQRALSAAMTQSRQRDEKAEVVADTTRTEAHQVAQEIQATAATVVERVRVVTREIKVPSDCPSVLPVLVADEGRQAVERANAANVR